MRPTNGRTGKIFEATTPGDDSTQPRPETSSRRNVVRDLPTAVCAPSDRWTVTPPLPYRLADAHITKDASSNNTMEVTTPPRTCPPPVKEQVWLTGEAQSDADANSILLP
uniref:Uncharacterized protein n=1 Tax=Trichuris muris TaxID=70415 RepID=A0A5S6QV91_TRIMR